MNQKDNNVPKPLTKEEEIELKQLQTKLFGDDIFTLIEEVTPEVKRYDNLMSKKLTFMQYCLDMQIKKELHLMKWN